MMDAAPVSRTRRRYDECGLDGRRARRAHRRSPGRHQARHLPAPEQGLRARARPHHRARGQRHRHSGQRFRRRHAGSPADNAPVGLRHPYRMPRRDPQIDPDQPPRQRLPSSCCSISTSVHHRASASPGGTAGSTAMVPGRKSQPAAPFMCCNRASPAHFPHAVIRGQPAVAIKSSGPGPKTASEPARRHRNPHADQAPEFLT
jgi:hypothetical protein